MSRRQVDTTRWVVAVCLQGLHRRRVVVSMPVLVSDGGVVGDERGA
jgi:hypothetical protein